MDDAKATRLFPNVRDEGGSHPSSYMLTRPATNQNEHVEMKRDSNVCNVHCALSNVRNGKAQKSSLEWCKVRGKLTTSEKPGDAPFTKLYSVSYLSNLFPVLFRSL